MFSAEWIKEKLQATLSGAQVQVIDFAGDNDHFEIVVLYGGFAGKSLLERHRMVYSALGSEATQVIHAMKIKTQTLEEANK